jgi:hypothetical protein
LNAIAWSLTSDDELKRAYNIFSRFSIVFHYPLVNAIAWSLTSDDELKSTHNIFVA